MLSWGKIFLASETVIFWNLPGIYPDLSQTPKSESLCCCCSIAQGCPALCDPMDCNTPSFPVLQHLLAFAQVHVHCIISSSDALFSFCPQSIPASGTCPMSHLFASDDQNTEASASASVLSVNIQDQSPRCLEDFQKSSPVPQFEGINYLVLSAFFTARLSKLYVTTGGP